MIKNNATARRLVRALLEARTALTVDCLAPRADQSVTSAYNHMRDITEAGWVTRTPGKGGIHVFRLKPEAVPHASAFLHGIGAKVDRVVRTVTVNDRADLWTQFTKTLAEPRQGETDVSVGLAFVVSVRVALADETDNVLWIGPKPEDYGAVGKGRGTSGYAGIRVGQELLDRVYSFANEKGLTRINAFRVLLVAGLNASDDHVATVESEFRPYTKRIESVPVERDQDA